MIDATQGVQAQTLSVLEMAKELNLKIIPVLNKIDLPVARTDEVKQEVAELLNCEPQSILAVSGKTGAGVNHLLEMVIKEIPPPKIGDKDSRSLVFDFEYSTHRGVIVYIRVLDGQITKGDNLIFAATGEKFTVSETGIFSPDKKPISQLTAGEIGYLITGIKRPSGNKVGDTLLSLNSRLAPVAGYREPYPVVWASIYPSSQDDFSVLKQALERLKLSDSAISFEEEASGSLGRGFRCGFLGMLHLEITSERLLREFGLDLIIATPTTSYEIENEKNGTRETIYAPPLFPEELRGFKVWETWAAVKIIIPPEYLSSIIQLLHDHEAILQKTDNFGDNRTVLEMEMPLRELMRNFFDEIKSASSGFASLSYSLLPRRPADVVRLDILVGGEPVPAFCRIVSRLRVEKEAEESVDRLKKLIPRQLIVIKIQAQAMGRILAARSLSALKKDVTGYLYGGDITRKMKLREKQKKGKKKMQKIGKVNIPPDVFLKMMTQNRNGKE